MALRNFGKCACCDKVRPTTPVRDWCVECEREFAEWRARLPVECPVDCITPISCRITKRCLTAERLAAAQACPPVL